MKSESSNVALRNKYLSRQKGGSWMILCIALFSVINILLYAFGSDTYFLFTAYVPYLLGVFGVSCLKGVEGFEFVPALGIFFLSLTAVLIILYVVCCFLSRKRMGWLIVGTVLFSLDTLFMLCDMIFSEDPSWYVMDIIIHALALIELGIGISAAVKLKKLPADETTAEAETSAPEPSEVISPEPVNAGSEERSDLANEQPGISDEFKE